MPRMSKRDEIDLLLNRSGMTMFLVTCESRYGDLVKIMSLDKTAGCALSKVKDKYRDFISYSVECKLFAAII